MTNRVRIKAVVMSNSMRLKARRAPAIQYVASERMG
jgi:hypothetical protein